MHRIRSPGAASSSRAASAAAASTTCSQLSRITTPARLLSRSNSAASPPVTFSAAISTSTTSSAVVAASSRANQTPPGRGIARLSQRPAGGDRERGLADAAGTDDLDEPLVAPAGRTASATSDVASDQLDRHRRQVSRGRVELDARAVRSGTPSDASWTRICCSSCWSRGPGSRPSSSASTRRHALVGRERVGLAPGPVQRGDQQLPERFLERVRRHRGFEVADHVADVTESQPRRELGLDELHPCLDEPRPVRRDPVAVAGGREEVPAKHLQRRRTQVGGAAVVAGVEQTGRRDRVAQHRRARRPRTGRPRARSRRRGSAITVGSPSARRNLATFDCSVLRRVSTASAAHRSSTSRSVRTSTPASSARRTSSSTLFPPGTGTSWPSRRTSSGPSTEICEHVGSVRAASLGRAGVTVSAKCQRLPRRCPHAHHRP